MRVMVAVGLSICFGCIISCYRPDIFSVTIDVPEMSDDLAVRIITNAALNEIEKDFPTPGHEIEIDLGNTRLNYHEQGPRVMEAAYRERISACLRQVGYEPTFHHAGFNPTPIVHSKSGPFRREPNRWTLTMTIPGMKTVRDANVVVDAIGFARLGADVPQIKAFKDSRKLSVVYQAKNCALKNLEVGIASVGFAANGKRPHPATIPQGWWPVNL